MTGDGNCLFRSLSFPDDDHARMRERVVTYIEEQWEDHFRHFMTYEEQRTYVRDMKRNGVWGDELVLSAFASVYRRPVVVHSRPSFRVLRTYGTEFGPVPPVRVAFSGCHYDAVVTDDCPRR